MVSPSVQQMADSPMNWPPLGDALTATQKTGLRTNILRSLLRRSRHTTAREAQNPDRAEAKERKNAEQRWLSPPPRLLAHRSPTRSMVFFFDRNDRVYRRPDVIPRIRAIFQPAQLKPVPMDLDDVRRVFQISNAHHIAVGFKREHNGSPSAK